jgi:hypothetical protein
MTELFDHAGWNAGSAFGLVAAGETVAGVDAVAGDDAVTALSVLAFFAPGLQASRAIAAVTGGKAVRMAVSEGRSAAACVGAS